MCGMGKKLEVLSDLLPFSTQSRPLLPRPLPLSGLFSYPSGQLLVQVGSETVTVRLD